MLVVERTEGILLRACVLGFSLNNKDGCHARLSFSFQIFKLISLSSIEYKKTVFLMCLK